MISAMGNWADVWLAWLIAALASFLAIELTAVFTHRMDRTLSERLRAWLGIQPIRPWRKLATVLFASLLSGGLGILIWHILTP